VTNTTNAGPNRRSVTFKKPENKKPKEEKDEFLGSMLRKPLEPIMSIGSPIVRQKDGMILGASESSAADEIHEQNDARANGSGLHGEQQQNPNDPNDSLAKHRVRANPNASLPTDLSIEQVPLGAFKKGTTLPTPASGISDTGMDQIPLGKFQKGKMLTQLSWISNGSDRGSDRVHGSNHDDSVSTLGNSDRDQRETAS